MKAIFEGNFGEGHRIEYLYHVCEYIQDKAIKDVLVFGPAYFFEELQERFDLPQKKDYSFYKTLSKPDLDRITYTRKFRKGFATINILKKLAKQYNITHFFLLSYDFAFDVIPFKKTKFNISGIKYHVNDDIVNPEVFRGVKSICKRYVFSKTLSNKSIQKLYILNNPVLVERINSLYESTKAQTLNDPVLNLKEFFPAERHKKESTPKYFIHLGLLNERKGTKELILALKCIPSNYRNKFKMIIAGKADESYFNQLEQTKAEVEKETGLKNIILTNKFLPINELHDYLCLADFIILPYKLTEMSSGIVGHAINYRIPLIVPNSGFYKQLLEQYHVGFSMTPNIEGISEAVIKAIDEKFKYDSESARKFLTINSPEAFALTILNSF